VRNKSAWKRRCERASSDAQSGLAAVFRPLSQRPTVGPLARSLNFSQGLPNRVAIGTVCHSGSLRRGLWEA
jgi:hypothetical protein